MELKEVNVPEGIVQQIDPKGSFAGITVDVGNADYPPSNFNFNVSYEDTLEDIERTIGSVPVFMKFLHKKALTHNCSSWKMVDEINMERARYLLNSNEMLEEMLSKTQE